LELFSISILPGRKEGISGSSVSGNNVGIIKNVSEEKREASIEVLKFFASRQRQEQIFKNRFGLVAYNELLEEEDLCGDEICDIVKEMQFTGEPKFIKNGPDGFRKYYKKYIYEFLYENSTIEETLKQLDDVTKIYYVKLGTEDSYIGLVWFIFMSVVSVLMLLSIVFLFKDNFHPLFMFLPEGIWIITILGSILLLWVPYFNYGSVNKVKCHLRPLFMTVGYTLNICPTFYKLIFQFPEKTKIIRWVMKHKYLFLLFNLLIDCLLCSISFINPYTSQYVWVEDGENFEKCRFNGIYSIIILIVYKFLIILLMLFLIFVEWNISKATFDLKISLTALYSNMLFIGLILVFNTIDIKNYQAYFVFQSLNVSIISITNYLLLYGFKVVIGLLRKQNVKMTFINNVNEKFINDESQLQSEVLTNSDENNENTCIITLPNENNNFISRMIKYHYYEEDSSTNNYDTSNIDTKTTNSYD